MATLPLYFEDMKPLAYEWFPTLWQCFIYRNWEMVTPSRIARVLSCEEKVVKEAAFSMGLADNAANEELWLTRGYVTLIRANWHLLTYPQLCTLLGWEEDYLAYILKEDDFLDVKLGRKKPPVDTLTVTPLTEKQKKQTAAICRVTKELYCRIPTPTAAPFAFSAVYPKELSPVEGESRLSGVGLCAYEALFGDIFYDHSLIEKSLPEELLAAYAALGIRSITFHAVLYSMIPCKYDLSLSEGWQTRIEGLKKVIARLGKYGIKPTLYINEPRELSDAVFEKHPHLRGDVHKEGYASICLSVPEAQDFLRDSIRTLTELAPGIGAYSICVAQENHTNCYSHKADGATTCPRCAKLRRSDLFALVARLVSEGAHAVDPTIGINVSAWGFHQRGGNTYEAIEKLPEGVAVGAVSEHGVKRTYEDVTVSVGDYSISIPGPGEYAKSVWKKARETGKRVSSKIQLNNSWELSTVPYIPVFGHFYTAVRQLLEEVSPDTVGTTWTMGGFPSPVFCMFAKMTRKNKPIPPYEELVLGLFPNADKQTLLSAFSAFDEAFDEFPFSVPSMYNGPQHMGPSLPLWREPTGWKSCMVGQIYDDMEFASELFKGPFGVFMRQYERLAEKWAKGLALLKKAYEGCTVDAADQMLLECAEVSYMHFASARNHLHYIKNRGGEDVQESILREEEAFAIREAELMGKNPAIGFESASHYFFTRTDLFEKVLNCRYLLGELE